VQLAENVFQMNVTPGHTTAISGLTAALDQPEFATAIGLLKYGSLRQRKHLARPSLVSGIKGVFGKLMSRS
jgi:cell division ATPase FtsA